MSITMSRTIDEPIRQLQARTMLDKTANRLALEMGIRFNALPVTPADNYEEAVSTMLERP
jgi:hypothetical protein